jgi:5-methyltetrahydropteroyltriglutamate--homocysteine methyltransferase
MSPAANGLPLLPITTVGSHPRPAWWYLAAQALREDRLGSQDLAETVNHAVDIAILEQERLGLDVITDGEMWHLGGWLQNQFGGIQGLRSEPATARRLGPSQYDMRTRHIVAGPVSAPNGLGMAQHFPYLREHATRPTKVTCPGPLTFAGSCEIGPPYGDMWELAGDLANVVNAELKACVAAGADFVQIDDPWLGCLPDESRGIVELVNRTVEGVNAKTALHICFGTHEGRPRGCNRTYRPLFPDLLEARVDQFLFEFANRQMADIELWQEYQPRQELVVGVVDQKAYHVETPELVAERIRRALEYVPVEKLWVSADCGLGREPYWLGMEKLRALVAGVAIVRRELTGSDA